MKFAAENRHGFVFTNDQLIPIDCFLTQSTIQPHFNISFHSPDYLHLHLPFFPGKRWQEIEVEVSKTRNSLNELLFTIYDRWPTSHNDAVSQFLAVELRQKQLWCVVSLPNGVSQSVSIPGWKNEKTKLILGIASQNNVTVLAVETDTFPVRYLFLHENTNLEWMDANVVQELFRGPRRPMNRKEVMFGQNLILGGSNWTAEAEFGRQPPQLWSGLGQRNAFSGCIHK